MGDREILELVSGGLLTVGEAGEFLRLKKSTLYQLMSVGVLPYTVVAGRRRRIPRAAVLRLAAEGMRGNLGAVTD